MSVMQAVWLHRLLGTARSVCRTAGGTICLSVAGPIKPSMQAKANSFVAETNACIPEYLCFAQLNLESVIVHLENLMRQDGSGASGSRQGGPLDCRLSHRRRRLVSEFSPCTGEAPAILSQLTRGCGLLFRPRHP